MSGHVLENASTEEIVFGRYWREIETAPKDGTHLLLGSEPDQWVGEGYYEADGDRGWYQAGSHWTDPHDGSMNPTHWQPMPGPPQR